MHNIHPHTYTYIHKKRPKYMQIHTHTYQYGLKYVPVCGMYDPFKRRIYHSYMHIHHTYRILRPDIHSIQICMYLYVSFCI